MQDTFLNVAHQISVALVSGFHVSELLVASLVGLGFIAMAVLGREERDAAHPAAHAPDAGWIARPR